MIKLQKTQFSENELTQYHEEVAIIKYRNGITQEKIKSALAIAEEFDMANVLSRYCRDYSINEETARLHEKELKRYLLCCALIQGTMGMRGIIDELWHTFLLFSIDYARFCDDIAGSFIHHIPGTTTQPGHRNVEEYKFFISAYAHLFNEYPPEEFWPKTGDAECMNGCGGGCGGCRDDILPYRIAGLGKTSSNHSRSI